MTGRSTGCAAIWKAFNASHNTDMRPVNNYLGIRCMPYSYSMWGSRGREPIYGRQSTRCVAYIWNGLITAKWIWNHSSKPLDYTIGSKNTHDPDLEHAAVIRSLYLYDTKNILKIPLRAAQIEIVSSKAFVTSSAAQSRGELSISDIEEIYAIQTIENRKGLQNERL